MKTASCASLRRMENMLKYQIRPPTFRRAAASVWTSGLILAAGDGDRDADANHREAP
jgi:hypothetical protein